MKNLRVCEMTVVASHYRLRSYLSNLVMSTRSDILRLDPVGCITSAQRKRPIFMMKNFTFGIIGGTCLPNLDINPESTFQEIHFEDVLRFCQSKGNCHFQILRRKERKAQRGDCQGRSRALKKLEEASFFFLLDDHSPLWECWFIYIAMLQFQVVVNGRDRLVRSTSNPNSPISANVLQASCSHIHERFSIHQINRLVQLSYCI